MYVSVVVKLVVTSFEPPLLQTPSIQDSPSTQGYVIPHLHSPLLQVSVVVLHGLLYPHIHFPSEHESELPLQGEFVPHLQIPRGIEHVSTFPVHETPLQGSKMDHWSNTFKSRFFLSQYEVHNNSKF